MIQRSTRKPGLLFMALRTPEHGITFTIHGTQCLTTAGLGIEVIQ